MKSTSTALTIFVFLVTLEFVDCSEKMAAQSLFRRFWLPPPKRCGLVMAPSNGHIHPSIPSFNGEILSGATISFSCDDGYRLTHTNYIRCSRHGHWIGSIPRCIYVRCAPVQLENVRVEYDEKPINGSYPELSQVEFSCDEGLELQGERCAKCRAAVWNNLDLMPTCVKVGNCFPSSAKVKLESGKIVPMSELQIGDQVQTVSSDTRVRYSKVRTFLKAQQDVINNYKSITCGNKTIALSEDHLIYAKQTYNDRFTPIYSDQVSIGDEVLVEQNHGFVPAKVTKVSSHLFQGAYVPLTAEGNIVVDGVLASCYASDNHDLVHIGMGPIRWFPNIVETILGQDNGYAAYASIAHTVSKWMFLGRQLGGQ